MKEPVVVPDAVEELSLERVAAIDVAKGSGKVCLRVPDDDGSGRSSRVWDVNATMDEVQELADHLRCQQVQMVTLESTSDYWRIFYYVLESSRVPVMLVNSRDVRNVPGRPKTDKLDAIWLAKLTERGMLRSSFVPPAPVRQLRDFTRMRSDLTGERTRCWQRMEKLLEDALIKVTSVASTQDTVSVRMMLRAMIGGERDPKKLADMAQGPMRAKIPALRRALNGRFDGHHAELARILLDHIDALDGDIAHLTGLVLEQLDQIPAAWGTDPDGTTGPGSGHEPGAPELPAIDRLAALPGLSRDTAESIIAEIGLDMSQFPTPEHLVSWAKCCGQTRQSGSRSSTAKAQKGNRYLKSVLGRAAASAARTDTFLGHRYRRLVKRMPKPKAMVAVARSLLVVIWHLLDDPTSRFVDLGPDWFDKRGDRRRQARNHIRQLKALGYQVTATPAT